jgi:hypothetical protein
MFYDTLTETALSRTFFTAPHALDAGGKWRYDAEVTEPETARS